jgi:ABC-type glutathione transport system ATPase component
MSEENNIIHIAKLKVSVIKEGRVILNGIDFKCSQSEILIILGKNGTGKTTLALSLTRLLNPNTFSIEGKIFFKNQNLLEVDEKSLLEIRRQNIGYILQNPFSAFNPVYRIKNQLEEISKLKNIPFENFIQLMNELDLVNYNQILNKYPFELSGGMLQRLSAIRVLASNPELIIADEPTSALDKPISNQLISLLTDYVKTRKAALIFITQDFSIAERFANKVLFLTNGKLIPFSMKDEFTENTNNFEIDLLLNSYKQLKL